MQSVQIAFTLSFLITKRKLLECTIKLSKMPAAALYLLCKECTEKRLEKITSISLGQKNDTIVKENENTKKFFSLC